MHIKKENKQKKESTLFPLFIYPLVSQPHPPRVRSSGPAGHAAPLRGAPGHAPLPWAPAGRRSEARPSQERPATIRSRGRPAARHRPVERRGTRRTGLFPKSNTHRLVSSSSSVHPHPSRRTELLHPLHLVWPPPPLVLSSRFSSPRSVRIDQHHPRFRLRCEVPRRRRPCCS